MPQTAHPHSAAKSLLATGAVVALFGAALILPVGAWGSPGAGYKACSVKDVKSPGLFALKVANATCTLARQVAFATVKRGTASTPKGFTCTEAPGGNAIPVTCRSGSRVVKFFLEG